MEFQLVVATHNITSQAYIDKVDRFCRGTAAADDLFGHLTLPNYPGTERPTGAHTPVTGSIYLKKTLGEGGFGVVTHYWNVSDASEFALKEPSVTAVRRRKVDYDAWRKEARIMGQVSHPNIVRLLGANFTPHPQLRLEYMALGSLDDQEDISPDETLSILCQCLSALAYLHGAKPAIVHRDIKPDNILVQHRFPGDICVKFGDFGLARDSSDLFTICGTRKYIAPEIYLEWECIKGSNPEERSSYTPLVDDWSLGVVAYELVCGLPRYLETYADNGAVWCEKIGEKIGEKFDEDSQQSPDDSEPVLSLLRSMIVLSPDFRSPAAVCYSDAMQLSCAAADGEHTPTAASPYASIGDPAADSLRPSELAYFMEEYSPDPFNSLYVGSSLASWGGGQSSRNVTHSSFTRTVKNQNGDSDKAIQGSNQAQDPVSPQDNPTVPRGQQSVWDFDQEYSALGYPSAISVSSLPSDEKLLARMLLEAIGQDPEQ